MPDNEFEEAEFDLTHYVDVVLRRRWIVLSVFTMIVISALLYAFVTRPVYRASTMLVIEKERGGRGVVAADGMMIQSSEDDYYQTQYKLLKSQSLLQVVYDKLGLEATEDFAQPHGLKKLDDAVIIGPVPRSRLVYVNAESHDPKLATSVANALAQAFVEHNLANQLFISKDVLKALQVKEGATSADRTYGALPAVVNNQLIQQLKAEYAKEQAKYADMSSRFMPKHPALIALKSDMAALDSQIRSETEKIVQSLKTDLSGQLNGNNVRIVDPAPVPERPVKPRKLLSLALGMIFGLCCGLGAALVVELIDQSIRTQEDVEQKLNQPFLGLVPLSALGKGPAYSSLLSKELSLTSEAVRNLRTMVDFAGATQNSKAVLVTSTVQGEGKSYIASNLAVAFSQLDEKVLLISGDLRRPSTHKIFGTSSERGLSEFLARGKDIEEIADLIFPTDISGLKVLPCGHVPPSPSELLNTPRLAALVAWTKANYDRVIVDCTPMFPIHDTLLWGRHVNSAIFVVRYGKTRAPMIAKACQRLSEAGVKVQGAVINAAKPGGLAYSSYGYAYQQYYHAYGKETAAGKVS